MTSREKENAVVKYKPSIFHENSFAWNICGLKRDSRQSSDFFQFGGYCFYLYIERDVTNYDYPFYTISLHGYPTPYRKKIYFRYSVVIKNDCGGVCHFSVGAIHTAEEYIDIVFHRGRLKLGIDYGSIFFSWRENGEREVNSQAVQTKPERIIVLEQGTQTEEAQVSPARDLCTHAGRPSNVANSETQTKSSKSPIASVICTHEGNETYKFLEILSKDLGSFYESKEDPDCVLNVGETKFHVHRPVLAARSAKFRDLFHANTPRSGCCEVDIQDVDSRAFGDVLYYIYTGKVRGLTSETVASMYVVAHKYLLKEFEEKCLDFLMHNLTIENVADAALLADTHSERNLENKITEFVQERLDDLNDNEKWMAFSETHYKLANKLLFSALRASRKKIAKLSFS